MSAPSPLRTHLLPRWFPWITSGVPEAPSILRNEADGTELLLVPAGRFLRGSPEGEGDFDEQPRHEVYLDSFYLAKYPVTNLQYRKFVEATGHALPRYWDDPKYNHDEQPVVGVTWEDAQAYCRWAGLRLPTAAEWEKAAGWDDEKEGKRRWPWGNAEPDPSLSNFGGHVGQTTAVGSYPAGVSPYGCHDLAGNVFEWMEDWYEERAYQSAPLENPRGPCRGKNKCLRGGSHFSDANDIRAAHRFWLDPDFSSVTVGFRCARSL